MASWGILGCVEASTVPSLSSKAVFKDPATAGAGASCWAFGCVTEDEDDEGEVSLDSGKFTIGEGAEVCAEEEGAAGATATGASAGAGAVPPLITYNLKSEREG